LQYIDFHVQSIKQCIGQVSNYYASSLEIELGIIMQARPQFTLKCGKCGKEVTGATEEEARERLKAHDEEMHEGSFQTECEKGKMTQR
jgi:hypothetical protein